jgi:hypothetical protein
MIPFINEKELINHLKINRTKEYLKELYIKLDIIQAIWFKNLISAQNI